MNDLVSMLCSWSGFALVALAGTWAARKLERHYEQQNRA